ncbi:hypothetical protein GGS21DRAFT_547305 [Xylaria nigripes]|nr:hypothetical protein GGS21DRAFT_547305 [Xylaria nigripes]
MAEPAKIDLCRTSVLEPIDRDITIEKRWPRKNFFGGPPPLPPDFMTSDRVASCLDALYLLQSQRQQYVLETGLSVPLQFLHDSLPYMVQCDVDIFESGHCGFWTVLNWEDYLDQEEIDRLKQDYYEDLISRRYHFWPIDLNRVSQEDWDGPHWGLIVLHMRNIQDPKAEPDPDHDELEAPFNALQSFTVINPDHGEAARFIEEDVVQELLFLLNNWGIKVEGCLQMEPWVPPRSKRDGMNAPQLTNGDNKEYWSSGLRVFEMIRIMLERIAATYCKIPHSFDEDTFWAAHSGWFNPDAVRSNMIGCAATMVNRAMNSTTRIAIEPILNTQIKANVEQEADVTISTLAMMPNREELGGFDSTRPRESPAWFDDVPATAPQPAWRQANQGNSGDGGGNGDDDDGDGDGDGDNVSESAEFWGEG